MEVSRKGCLQASVQVHKSWAGLCLVPSSSLQRLEVETGGLVVITSDTSSVEVILKAEELPALTDKRKEYLNYAETSNIDCKNIVHLTAGDLKTLDCSAGDTVCIRRLQCEENINGIYDMNTATRRIQEVGVWGSVVVIVPATDDPIDITPNEVASTILASRWLYRNGQYLSLPVTNGKSVMGRCVCRSLLQCDNVFSQLVPNMNVQGCVKAATVDKANAGAHGDETLRQNVSASKDMESDILIRCSTHNDLGVVTDVTSVYVCVEGVSAQQRDGYAIYMPSSEPQDQTARADENVNFDPLFTLMREGLSCVSLGGLWGSYGLSEPTNILLAGDAGVGKTTNALSYALHTLRVPVVLVSMATMAMRRWNGAVSNPLSASINEAFATANLLSQCVIIVDDLEGLLSGDSTNVGGDEDQNDMERTLTRVLKRNEKRKTKGNRSPNNLAYTHTHKTSNMHTGFLTRADVRVVVVGVCRNTSALKKDVVSTFADVVSIRVQEAYQSALFRAQGKGNELVSVLFPSVYSCQSMRLTQLSAGLSDVELLAVNRVYKSLATMYNEENVKLAGSEVPPALEDAFRRVRTTAASSNLLLSKKITHSDAETVTWDDVSGLEDVKLVLEDAVVTVFRHADVFARLGIDSVRGVLLHGPPGTGKTMIAKAMAGRAGVRFVSLSIPVIVHGEVGESEKALSNAFSKARKAAPCILFFDEIQALFGKRSQGGNGRNLVTQLLLEMDSLSNTRGVVVVAATNVPELIDESLLQPGRLDEIVYVPPPDTAARLHILQSHLKRIGDGCRMLESEWSELVECLNGYTGADIANVCKQAVLLALKRAWATWKPDLVGVHDDCIGLDKGLSGIDLGESNVRGRGVSEDVDVTNTDIVRMNLRGRDFERSDEKVHKSEQTLPVCVNEDASVISGISANRTLDEGLVDSVGKTMAVEERASASEARTCSAGIGVKRTQVSYSKAQNIWPASQSSDLHTKDSASNNSANISIVSQTSARSTNTDVHSQIKEEHPVADSKLGENDALKFSIPSPVCVTKDDVIMALIKCEASVTPAMIAKHVQWQKRRHAT
eukprot:CFRG7695T1